MRIELRRAPEERLIASPHFPFSRKLSLRSAASSSDFHQYNHSVASDTSLVVTMWPFVGLDSYHTLFHIRKRRCYKALQ